MGIIRLLNRYTSSFSKVLIILSISLLGAQSSFPEKSMVVMGGGNSSPYTSLMQNIFAHSGLTNEQVYQILVLPTAYSSNSKKISEEERLSILEEAEVERAKLEETCKQTAPEGKDCQAILVPVLTRNDALNPANLEFFKSTPLSILILDGDQKVAIQTLDGTPIEAKISDAINLGTLVTGSGAGSNMLSKAMIAGYNPGFSAVNSMEFGATDLWNSVTSHGLSFGLDNAILEKQFFQNGNVGRLLNSLVLPNAPHLGIGLDAETGIVINENSTLTDTFGASGVAILDTQTYHAADTVEYKGPKNILSLRNILVHLLAPGSFSYDLSTRNTSLGKPAPILERRFDALDLPIGVGPIILTGNLSNLQDRREILNRFINLSGGENASLLVLSTGFSSNEEAESTTDRISEDLNVTYQTISIPTELTQTIRIPEGITGIILLGSDQSKMNLPSLANVKQAWLTGIPLLADNVAAEAMGPYYSEHENRIGDPFLQKANQRPLEVGNVKIEPGLNILNMNIESRLITGNRWGNYFNLGYAHPGSVSLGLDDNSVIEITSNGSTALSQSPLYILDLRYADLAEGSNKTLVIANGLLDVFAPGDAVSPEIANLDLAPLHAPTPILPTKTLPPPTYTPTNSPTSPPTETPTPNSPLIFPKPAATRTPRPTPTPMTIPPPTDPNRINLMILASTIAVLVVVIGIWINWHRIG